MKKLFLIAAIGAAGMMSANTDVQETLELTGINSLSTCTNFVVYTSCGFSASTCQNWSDVRAQEWANLVDEIYCGYSSLNEDLNADDGIDWNQ